MSIRFRWTVVCRRFDGSGDFNRSWIEYKNGFGDVSGEAWLGNEYLHYLTNTRSYKLRFDLEDWDGMTAYAEYSSFVVTSEADEYRLLLGDYSGNASANASDDLVSGFLYHNNMRFTTYDRDNDAVDGNCILRALYGDGFYGGFWYKYCTAITPTGHYCTSDDCGSYSRNMRWDGWRGPSYSLKSVTMMTRPDTY